MRVSPRRALPAAGLIAACAVAACAPAAESDPAPAPAFDTTALAASVDSLARRVHPGALGVAVKDLATGHSWDREGGRRFPMQSVFKAPLGAVVLAAAERGDLSLADTVTLAPEQLSPPYSPISAAFPQRRSYTVEELLVAAVGGSDNTAADVLMEMIGGPSAATQWLRSRGVTGLHIDRFEREFQIELNDMPPFRPEWRTGDAFLRAMRAVPEERRRRALADYLADPRDTSTPIGSVVFLEKLVLGELLPPEPTERLLRIMTETTTGARRIRAALPEGATLAHKTGSARPDLGMSPAVNDIGIITLPDGRRVVLAVYIAGTPLSYQDAEDVHAEVAQAVLESLRPVSP